jgi:hypothetical protein
MMGELEFPDSPRGEEEKAVGASAPSALLSADGIPNPRSVKVESVNDGTTHWEGCERQHLACALVLLEREREKTGQLLAKLEAYEQKPVTRPGKPTDWDDALDLLWNDFPRKVGKPAALKAWRAISPKTQETFDAIDEGLLKWVAYWSDVHKSSGRQFVCYPATWLNQRRWENEP